MDYGWGSSESKHKTGPIRRDGHAIGRFLSDTSGHTLAETLVAMTLFVGVLIPLLAAIGNLIFDDRAERLQEALHFAQSEIAQAEASQQFSGEHTQTIHGLTIERRVAAKGDLEQIDITVRDTKKGNRLVLHLTKTVILKNVASHK
jgi:competence protein ComGF